jgi:hypothetical protein
MGRTLEHYLFHDFDPRNTEHVSAGRGPDNSYSGEASATQPKQIDKFFHKRK